MFVGLLEPWPAAESSEGGLPAAEWIDVMLHCGRDGSTRDATIPSIPAARTFLLIAASRFAPPHQRARNAIAAISDKIHARFNALFIESANTSNVGAFRFRSDLP